MLQANAASITPIPPDHLPGHPRAAAETLIEAYLSAATALIAILDDLDGNPDEEDGHDLEPTLGSPNDHIPHGHVLAMMPARLNAPYLSQERWGDGPTGALSDEAEQGADDDLSCDDAGYHHDIV